MQRTPAGFPFSIPGIDEDIEGAMQQAAQSGRHFMWCFISGFSVFGAGIPSEMQDCRLGFQLASNNDTFQ